MGNRTAKFLSALLGSIIAGAPLAAVSQTTPAGPEPATTSTASTANDCLASPKGVAPQGQHWYYRLERSTKRQCWYLRAGGGKATQTAQATGDTPNADAPRSLQNARAEYVAPQAAPAAAAPPAASTPAPQPAASSAPQPAAATPWPDVTPPAPAERPAPTPAPIAAQPAKAAAPVAFAAAEIPAEKPTGSLQTLMLVIVGALALAGLLASVVYRFAGGRFRVQAKDRRVNWGEREPHDHEDSRAPWLAASPALRAHPVDFDAARQASHAPALTGATANIASMVPDMHREIAEFDQPEAVEVAEEFAIEAHEASTLAASEFHDDEPADHEDHEREAQEAVDIDVITAMLERLAEEGPRLTPPPSLEAALADLARSRQGPSAARA